MSDILTDTWKFFHCERRHWLVTKFRLQNGRAYHHYLLFHSV